MGPDSMSLDLLVAFLREIVFLTGFFFETFFFEIFFLAAGFLVSSLTSFSFEAFGVLTDALASSTALAISLA